MKTIDASRMEDDAILKRLLSVNEPVMLRRWVRTQHPWMNRSSFLGRHGAAQIRVGVEGIAGINWSTSNVYEQPLVRLRDHLWQMRTRGRSMSNTYVFSPIEGSNELHREEISVEISLLGTFYRRIRRMKLSSCDLDAQGKRTVVEGIPCALHNSQLESDHFFTRLRVHPRDRHALKQMMHKLEHDDQALQGNTYLSLGTDGSGAAFHTHGDTITFLVAGAKRWMIQKPKMHSEVSNRLKSMHPRDVPRHEIHNKQMWHCVQYAGDLLYIPSDLQHATLNMGDTFGITFHHSLLSAFVAQTLQTVLRHGALVNQPDVYGATPLHYATKHGLRQMVDVLLAHGADSRTNSGGRTPLHIATDVSIAHRLLRANASVCDTTTSRQLPLHLAAARGSIEISRLLLQHDGACGAVSRVDHHGGTPLQ